MVSDMTSLFPSRISRALFGAAVPRRLPPRIAASIRRHEDDSEILIGWVQIAAIVFFAVAYGLAPHARVPHMAFAPTPLALGAYALFTALRLVLAYRRRLSAALLMLSVVVDIVVLMVTIWSIHFEYRQPPAIYLKSPTLLYVFVIIALRALRFDPKWVLLAGATAVLGSLALLLDALDGRPWSAAVTHSYVDYVTSLKILSIAEVDKVVSIAMVSAVLGLAVARARRLLVQAVAEETAVMELSRFFSADVAQAIIASDEAIRPGDGVLREAAAMFIDLRGFTALSGQLDPRSLVALLGEYQHIVVTVTRRHGGSIITYLGDGIMVTFGATLPSGTYAADALAATEELIAALDEWAERRRSAALPAPRVGIGVATGTVIYGAVGDELRLEYAVIGTPVNTAAKIQNHTKIEVVHALITEGAWRLAAQQGFRPDRPHGARPGRAVHGLGEPIDLVAMD